MSNNSIEKRYGNVLHSGEFLTETEGKIIPTILSLDIALGGGIPEGIITSIAGKPKFGKTTTCLEIIVQAQKMGKKCYYADVESRLRTNLLKCINGLVWKKEQEDKLGIPALTIIRSAENRFLYAEDYMNIINTLITDEPGCLIVLDSIAAMHPKINDTKEIGENKKVMGVPTLMYEFLRTINPKLPVLKCNLITISHIQDSMQAYSGPNEVGGNAIKYLASTRLHCLSSSEIEEDGRKIGRDSRFKVLANALGAPGGEAEIPIRFGIGVDRYIDLFKVACDMGFIEKAASWFSFENDGEKVKLQGQNNVVEYFNNHPEFSEELEKQIRSMVFSV